MRCQIQLQVQRRSQRLCGTQLVEIRFKIGAGEHANHILGETRKIGRTALAQIPARQFVTPPWIGKLRDGPLVRLFGLRAHLVLLEKSRQAIVQARIVGIAVDFAAVERERVARALERYQPSDVAVENSRSTITSASAKPCSISPSLWRKCSATLLTRPVCSPTCAIVFRKKCVVVAC